MSMKEWTQEQRLDAIYDIAINLMQDSNKGRVADPADIQVIAFLAKMPAEALRLNQRRIEIAMR